MNKVLGFSAQEMRLAIWSGFLGEVVADTGSQIFYDEDESSVQIRVVLGDLTWMRYRLRDRSNDGPGWTRTALIDWDYDKEVDRFSLGRCAEESVYCLDPRVPLTERFSLAEASFIRNPFDSLPFSQPSWRNLSRWLDRWKGIFDFGRHFPEYLPFPGYFCLKNIPGARNRIALGVNDLLRSKGYEYISAVPTWWHTANMLGLRFGFSYQNATDGVRIDLIRRKLPFGGRTEIDRRRASWVVMLQFWAELVEQSGLKPESFQIGSEFVLRGEDGKILTFPLSPERNLWMVHRL